MKEVVPIDPRTLRDVMAQWPSGVTVVTTLDADGAAHGMTASSFSSVSLAALADRTFWTVFDDAALDAATGDRQLAVGKEPDEVRAMAGARPGVHRASALGDLAAVAGIDAAGLAATVAAYNDAVHAGVDREFGRTHLPAPISRAPYYAIRNHAITLVTFQGLDIDAECRVLAESGGPILGLHAVGEVIGAGATCGNSFCSGMLLTPALTLGRLLGERLAREASPGAGPAAAHTP